MDRAKLKRTVEAIEAAEQSIKDLSAHKRDLYAGVKDEFEPKVLRKIIQRRKMDPESRTKDDDLLDQYESALGMTGELAKAAASGEKTYDEAADEAGVSRRTMARHVARARGVPKATDNGATKPDAISPPEAASLPLRDPSTGEITPTHEMGAEHAINSDAAPEGCVDGPSVLSSPAETIVPPSTTPQADGVATASATPVPDEGVKGLAPIPTREGEREGTGNLDVARFAPHPDERADTATQLAEGQLPVICTECGEDWHGGDCAPVPDAQPRALSPVELAEVGDVEEEGLSALAAQQFNQTGPLVVTSTQNDPNPLPSFLRRVVVAPSKTPEQLDEREERAAQ